jgi:hypothetical protein
MTRVLGILGALAAAGYRILFDPSRQPAPAAWTTWDYELIAMYGAAGFAAGWILAVLWSRVGPDK